MVDIEDFSEGEEDLEQSFMKGYTTEEEIEVCAECGTALHDSSISREIEGEQHLFCSKSCAEDFEDSI